MDFAKERAEIEEEGKQLLEYLKRLESETTRVKDRLQQLAGKLELLAHLETERKRDAEEPAERDD